VTASITEKEKIWKSKKYFTWFIGMEFTDIAYYKIPAIQRERWHHLPKVTHIATLQIRHINY